MPTNEVNLGAGAASGMFFHAPKDTALPAYPMEELDPAWEEVGFVAEDGITWHHGRSATPLKDWSNMIRRQLQDDPTGTVAVPVISTTAEVLKTIFGESNVTEVAATNEHGKLVSVEVKEGVVSGEEAFLLLMKDGDDMIAIGAEKAQISAVDNVSFAPNASIMRGFTSPQIS